MKYLKILALSFCCIHVLHAAEKNMSLFSPDKQTEVKITIGENITFSLKHNNRTLLDPSPIAMKLYDGTIWGKNPKLDKRNFTTVNDEVKPKYGQNSVISERYNELSLRFRGGYGLIFRAYDEGIAYRFTCDKKGELIIKDEETAFAFPENFSAYCGKGKIEEYLHETIYEHTDINKIDSGRVAVLPMLIDVPDGPKLVITESDISDYPGMYLTAEGNTLKARFRHYPSGTDSDDRRRWTVKVTETTDFIAKTTGERSFPWRVMVIADQEKHLLNSELVYLLAPKQHEGIDFSFVKPGLITNDWWDLWWDKSPGATGVQEVILTGVDFKSGTNFETYKYIIDYAIENNIEYVNMDYGWCNVHDFGQIHPRLDLQKLLAYSKQHNKRIFMWCLSKTLCRDLEKNMQMFENWGIAGLKVDFFERDDQLGMRNYQIIAESAARHHLMIEFHGSNNPAGLSRRYPNVLTYESVYGSEQNNYGNKADPKHNVTMPFIRSVSGPFDYAPGAMDNVSKARFYPFSGFPLSLGTRAHQIAMFVIYYSPLQFMCDVPTSYVREPLCLRFISAIPSTWDKTIPIDGKIGEYAAVARKKENQWYLGAMTDWSPRTLTFKCDFLEPGTYDLEIFKDGVNANLNGNDYKVEHRTINAGEEITAKMAPGGGWAARFSPRNE